MNDFLSWLTGLIAAIVPGMAPDPDAAFNGYVEADYVYVAPAGSGRIQEIAVEEGAQVTKGQILFRLEDHGEQAAFRAATARVAVAEANLDNLRTGMREAETDVIRAALNKARADLHLKQTVLERTQQLFGRDLVPSADVDRDQAAFDSANAEVERLTAELQVAMLPARDAQRLSAEASLAAARAEADLAETALRDREVPAPTGGLVEQVFHKEGEVAANGAVTVSILPPDSLKVLFFVPVPQSAVRRVGEKLGVECDGCPGDMSATITRMAVEPQHTPPIIYSREERDRLVFRTEARLDNADGLFPGQPVTVRPVP